ncbi:sigma 54-interacting transcriptional regulator [Nocardiopsis potens]|uniref:sigma 54-interacting transcriptional regulator n=1 Tax=Nocardiopsis potens TaxID=1246458 RepID=UPI000475A70B|nr:sigma 54-interacting transcriptional regulator [Nocardiopsis potens]
MHTSPPLSTHVGHPPPDGLPRTVGELRSAGHRWRSVKDEVRENLLERLRSGRERFPGMVGFDATVLPQVERALLARQDVVLLGERGQGKSRLIRAVGALLDEWTPVVEGCPIGDHPYAPQCPRCRRLGAAGEPLPVGWLHRDERYREKTATPDTGVADLIGDIDPARLAEGRSLDDPEVVHYGLVPRANRGVLALNELPDLAARVQVALLGVLEERELQVRGHVLRLPVDVIVLASANPEDYTDRGRIITPLKDRFGAEVRTHYPEALEDEVALVRQEAADPGGALVPAHVVEVVARFTRMVRASPAVEARSGVSARFAIAAVRTAAASAERRAALTAEKCPTARVSDLQAAVPVLRGKVEFAPGEEGQEAEVLGHLLRRATAEVFRDRLPESALEPLTGMFAAGGEAVSGAGVPSAELLGSLGPLPGPASLVALADAGREPLAGDEAPAEGADRAEGLAAAAADLALEGLYLTRRLSKETAAPAQDRSTYRT